MFEVNPILSIILFFQYITEVGLLMFSLEFRMFASVFIKDNGLAFSFLVMSCQVLVSRLCWPHIMSWEVVFSFLWKSLCNVSDIYFLNV